MGRHTEHVDPAGGHLDHKQHIQPLQQHGVHAELRTSSASHRMTWQNIR
jgi:hypothetical protein